MVLSNYQVPLPDQSTTTPVHVKNLQIPPGSIGQPQLSPGLWEIIDLSRVTAEAVAANKEVWNRAAAITEDGHILTGLLQGTIPESLLDASIVQTLNQVSLLQQDVEGIQAAVARLDETDPATFYGSIKLSWDRIESTVAILNESATHPQQFSSIKQTATDIQSVVATLNDDPNALGQFSSIRQTADSITSIVGKLEGPVDAVGQFSAIQQLSDQITLAVKAGEIISAINLSTEGAKIQAPKIEFVYLDGSGNPYVSGDDIPIVGGGQRVLFDGQGITSFSADGKSYSRLNSERLTFYNSTVGTQSLYAGMMISGEVQDEEVVDFSQYGLEHPRILLVPQTFLAYNKAQTGSNLIVECHPIEDGEGQSFRAQVKARAPSALTPLPTVSTRILNGSAGGAPVDYVQGPLDTSQVEFQIYWQACSTGDVLGKLYVSNAETQPELDPSKWTLKKSFREVGPLINCHSGTKTWKVALDRSQGPWWVWIHLYGNARYIPNVQQRGGITSAGYRTSQFYDLDGNLIAGSAASGMTATYFVIDGGIDDTARPA